jgi:hypothetical protein
MAKARPEKKRDLKQRPTPRSSPMELQVGDRLADTPGE